MVNSVRFGKTWLFERQKLALSTLTPSAHTRFYEKGESLEWKMGKEEGPPSMLAILKKAFECPHRFHNLLE